MNITLSHNRFNSAGSTVRIHGAISCIIEGVFPKSKLNSVNILSGNGHAVDSRKSFVVSEVVAYTKHNIATRC
jgi:hypothetical protein